MINNISLPPPPSPRHSRVTYLVTAFALLALLLGGVVWYGIKNKTQPQPPVPTPAPQQVFDPKTQFVPKGAESRDVDQTLAAFGFTKPLPFFDKNNVVQSFHAKTTQTTATSSTEKILSPINSIPLTYLGYAVYGQSTTTLKNAFAADFTSMGWVMQETRGDSLTLFFFPDKTRIISVTFLDPPPVAGITQHITVVVTLRKKK